MGLQFPEEQLDLPSQRVGACNIVRLERVRRNVRQVYAIVAAIVTNASGAAECPVRVTNAAVSASFDVQSDLKVNNGALGSAEHRLQERVLAHTLGRGRRAMGPRFRSPTQQRRVGSPKLRFDPTFCSDAGAIRARMA
jgi:hypothetical protein